MKSWKVNKKVPPLLKDIKEFFILWSQFVSVAVRRSFFGFESFKTNLAELLYKQRGKFARPFIHSGMIMLSALGIMLAPVISEQFPGTKEFLQVPSPSAVLSAATENPETETLVSEKPRDKIIEYEVQSGDTLASIAAKFQVTENTVIWQNNITKKTILKPGQKLEILPVSGVAYTVHEGDTIYSIAKRYSAEPQGIVDFPFNTFVNDETFALAVGQILIVPGGVPPSQAPSQPVYYAQKTPDAGTVVAHGSFVWPTTGTLTQGFSWYHKAVDIANNVGPNILAADSGTVIIAGWPDNSGYGNRVVVDHGNGYTTLYAHMSQIYVKVGQTVSRGDALGRMGSTGRSTGTHLHFEVIRTGVHLNPLSLLK